MIILTARGNWQDEVEGLNAGADDFVVKPVHSEELIARLHAQIRRREGNGAPLLKVGDLTLDPAARAAMRAGDPLDLSRQEFRLLEVFMRRPGHILSQADLLERLYPLAAERDWNTLEVQVSRLRRKLGRAAISTVRGLGYRLSARSMSGRISLRSCFALAMLAWVCAGLVLIGITTSMLFHSHVEQLFHAELEEHLVELIGLTEYDALGRPTLARPLYDPRYGAERSGYYWQISRNAGPALRSPSLGNGVIDDRLAHTEGTTHVRAPGPSGEAIVYGVTRPHPDGQDRGHYLVATDARHLDDLVARFQRDLLVWMPVLGVLLLGGALLALRFATRPFDALAAAVARVRSGTDKRMAGPWHRRAGWRPISTG